MNFKKPIFWDLKKPNLISYLLLPLTIPTIINNILIKFLDKKSYKKIKSICVGNIYVGGTGKTPSAIKLYEIINNLGYNVCVGKKFYISHKDEQIILESKTKLLSEISRKKIVEKAIQKNNEIIIFDDGLQDRDINYNLKFVCFDAENWIGNGFLIPAGPLRETIKSLKRYDAIILKGAEEDKNKDEILKKIKTINSQIKIFFSSFVPINLEKFDLSKKYLIFSGIGNPNSFKNLLIKNNFNIINEIIYPDHFSYNQNDIDSIKQKAKLLNARIITTEKDFSKVSKLDYDEIDYLETNFEIEDKVDLINFLKRKINE